MEHKYSDYFSGGPYSGPLFSYFKDPDYNDPYVYEVINQDTESFEEGFLAYRDAVMFCDEKAEVSGFQYCINRVSDGIKMYDTSYPDILKYYLQYESEEWKTLTGLHHEPSTEPSVYFDIDGTLGYWYSDGRGMSYPEEVLDPKNHYFLTIEPHPFMTGLAGHMQDTGMDVCIISAADRDTIIDKWAWIKNHMPFVREENIFFCPLGADKRNFVKENTRVSMLVDDYPKNLKEWDGLPVKAINTVNSHQEAFYEINCKKAEEDFCKDSFLPVFSYVTDSLVAIGRDAFKKEMIHQVPVSKRKENNPVINETPIPKGELGGYLFMPDEKKEKGNMIISQ